jgi:ribosome recycling factor
MDELLLKVRDRMRKALEIVTNDIATIRSGRATPSLIEHLVILAYDRSQRLKLMEMATITTMDAKTLVIVPFDPSVVADIEKGIMEANIGLTPVVEGESLRITIPPLSEERRNEYIKLAGVKLEAGRIMVRQIRHDVMQELRRNELSGTITQDARKVGEKKIQELTDEMMTEIEVIRERKERELREL